ncbi:DUF642 domain-containing protein [Kitasatospora purpeofusca]|uniref:DUF642 domain-containing protein n=1 Tax=Kitasatospora purpeofusca TaxID=67352 RepID=UPI003694F157
MATDIKNADFSEPTVAPPAEFLTVVGPDGRTIPGWQVARGKVQLIALDTGQRPQGDGQVAQAVRLKEDGGPGGIGEICQDIRTTPGSKVTLTWFESPDITTAARGATNEQSYAVAVQPATGDSVGPVMFYPGDDVRGPHWKARRLDFTAAAEVTTIEFSALVEGLQSPLITGLKAADGSPPPPPPPVADFKLRQPDPVEAAPGEAAKLNVEIGATTDDPVEKDGVPQVFTAPTGIVFTGGASYGCYFGDRPHPTGNLSATVGDGGRTITVSDRIAINTSPQTRKAITYTFGVRVKPDATRGTYTDGCAKVGSQSVPLTATVH